MFRTCMRASLEIGAWVGYNKATVGGVEGEALVCSVAVSGMRESLDSGLPLATAVQIGQMGNRSCISCKVPCKIILYYAKNLYC